jgi:hypothetical protein
MNKLLKTLFELDGKKFIAYSLLMIIFLILPGFASSRVAGVSLAMVGILNLFLFMVAIIYTMSAKHLTYKEGKKFGKHLLKFLFLLIFIPFLFSVMFDFIRLIYITISGADRMWGYNASQILIWVSAFIWFVFVYNKSIKKVYDKNKKQKILTVYILSIIIYGILRYIEII